MALRQACIASLAFRWLLAQATAWCRPMVCFLFILPFLPKEPAFFGEGVVRPPRTRPLAEDISIAIDTTTGMICIWDLSGAHVIKLLHLAGLVSFFRATIREWGRPACEAKVGILEGWKEALVDRAHGRKVDYS